ncbi:MAG: RHS repeat-associated core domain-containing protein [Gammaproteobacteria bacterium]
MVLPEAKLYHYKARVYDPTLGRFLHTDPVGYQADFNLQAYAGNDPVNKTDPTALAQVCTEVTGSRIASCVNVDGNGDENTKDGDLTKSQISGLGHDSHDLGYPRRVTGAGEVVGRRACTLQLSRRISFGRAIYLVHFSMKLRISMTGETWRARLGKK